MTILRQIFLSALLMLIAAGAYGQITPTSALTTLPDRLYPYMSQSSMLDMNDYYHNGITRPMVNLLSDTVRLVSMTDCMATMSVGSDTLSVVVLPKGKKQIIMTITTLGVPEPDSEIKFFDNMWQPVDADRLITLPGRRQWFEGLGRNDYAQISQTVPFVIYSATFDPATSILSLTPHLSGRYVEPLSLDEMTDKIRPVIRYKWNGKRFVKVK